MRHGATGTVNAVFRVGDDLAARLPLAAEIQDWNIDCALAALAGRLPLDTPTVLGTGEPDHGYPLRWSLHTWVPGERWRLDRVEDPAAAAVKLAEFLNTLHHIDPATLQCPPLLDGHAAPLVPTDLEGRARAVRSEAFDTTQARAIWEAAMAAPAWDGPATLIHWDLLPGNVLVRDGQLAGIIDWGALTTGDPARDLIAAWTLFRREARTAFRAAVEADDATWARAKGWVFTLGRKAITELLTDPS